MVGTNSYPMHGGQLRQIAERFGIDESLLLDFSANINPEGPPAAGISALRAGIEDLSTLTEYPDLQQTVLRRAIATHVGVETENIVVANGFVPLLEATLKALKIRSCLLPVPAFVEYRKTLERSEVEIMPHLLKAESGFNYDPTEMFGGTHDAILLANPQNPSGVCHGGELISAIVAQAREKNIFVLLDEAFIDYAPQHALTSATNDFSNLIVFRSVTKFYGMPGLRVAYAVANSSLASSINDKLAPWPVTTLASHAVCAALPDEAYAARTIQENLHRKAALEGALKSLGFAVYPSDANFLLFHLTTDMDPNYFWEQMIVTHHIVLRNCGNYEGLAPGHFRVAVRTEKENTRLQKALKATISS